MGRAAAPVMRALGRRRFIVRRWFPWKWFVQYAARSFGILDPAGVLARVRRFAEPSEVDTPIEIIRAWVLFHARGVVNTRAIQNNLDWVWPYWVHRQFAPRDPAFIPRSYSLTHINLTHRNWTAVGLPGEAVYPLVDPSGLVTPLYDGWSIDFWLLDDAGELLPSKLPESHIEQTLHTDGQLAVETVAQLEERSIRSRVHLEREDDHLVLRVDLRATSARPAGLAVLLRPYNPEGVQFIDKVESLKHAAGWRVNGHTAVELDANPDRYAASRYAAGDVHLALTRDPTESGALGRRAGRDEVGMLTAAAVYDLQPGEEKRLGLRVPLDRERRKLHPARTPVVRAASSWRDLDDRSAACVTPDAQYNRLYASSLKTLLLLTADEIYPGPYVYRRFWYRDACFILNALMRVGHADLATSALEGLFVHEQQRNGFFRSQDGEWDANGLVLWLAGTWAQLTGVRPSERLVESLDRGTRWIAKKRLPRDLDQPHAGLLPAGFSAEHLGMNNHYYWDDYAAVAGLRAAAPLFDAAGRGDTAEFARREADDLAQCIDASLATIPEARSEGGIPAAPNRRMDAGAIGSLVADHPLQLTPPGDPRIIATNNHLYDHCRVHGGFFQDITHSGVNAYLTLHMAQVYLRAGDGRHVGLTDAVAKLASPTGLWPEAIHPATYGGCMGDGQHAWAAADWILILRARFVREEQGRRLILGSGLPPDWIETDQPLRFGPTATPYGEVTVHVEGPADARVIQLEADWREQPPRVEIRVPGRRAVIPQDPLSPIPLEFQGA